MLPPADVTWTSLPNFFSFLRSPEIALDKGGFVCIIMLIRLAEVDSQWLSGKRPKGRFLFKAVIFYRNQKSVQRGSEGIYRPVE